MAGKWPADSSNPFKLPHMNLPEFAHWFIDPSAEQAPEAWLRGPLKDIPAQLQPPAHALLQTAEEVHAYLKTFPQKRLWDMPFGVASVGFHLQHMRGVQLRMLTYARNEALSAAQLLEQQSEGKPADPRPDLATLIGKLDEQIRKTLKSFAEADPAIFDQARVVGRLKYRSTVRGLYFHAAEHCQRHCGQLYVTARFLQQNP